MQEIVEVWESMKEWYSMRKYEKVWESSRKYEKVRYSTLKHSGLLNYWTIEQNKTNMIKGSKTTHIFVLELDFIYCLWWLYRTSHFAEWYFAREIIQTNGSFKDEIEMPGKTKYYTEKDHCRWSRGISRSFF